MYLLDTDAIERLQVLFIFIVELCRIGMGCFTSLFVSHKCGEKECTLNDNISPKTIGGIIVLLCNICSFLTFICLYIVELRRENWLIEYLDKNNDLPETYLKDNIDDSLKKIL